jgi:signal transduction histidine kinase/ActR/RegA family two-component response regulator
MIDHRSEPLEERVLVLAPTARDATTSRDILAAAEIPYFLCTAIEDVCREAERGAGAAVITAEALLRDKEACLARWLKAQPPWSDFPLIVLTPPGAESAKLLGALEAIANMTLMKRPVEVSTLLSTIRSALRDRRRQYAVGDLWTERGQAEEEVRRAAAALRDADRRKDDFLALLAHELRNPLAPLRNGLQVLRLASGDASAVAQTRAMMDRQLGHMVRLIDDLLDISLISRNKMELRRARVLLADVISNAVETARPAIEAAGHELTVTLPPAPIFLNVDLTRLAQVFSNLLSNSAKYTERGGRIWLSGECEDGMVTVAVRDNGIGIPTSALPSVFDMFSQVDRSIERSTGGLGIGLALVKGLVEMHGGTVSAESDGPATGSVFTVKLPVLECFSDSLTVGTQDNPQAVQGPKRRVLVVDDNRDSAASMSTMLRLLGNDVVTARDGIDALEAAATFRPQVILMDLGMPRLNGLDATRRIREQPWGEHVIIIAVTGWGQEGDKARSKEAGCDGHLVKPVNLSELEVLLTKLTADHMVRA